MTFREINGSLVCKMALKLRVEGRLSIPFSQNPFYICQFTCKLSSTLRKMIPRMWFGFYGAHT